MLLKKFITSLQQWECYFCQHRTLLVAIRLAVSLLVVPGRKTVSRALLASGRQDCDWSADYKLFSRSSWKSNDLFRPAIEDSVCYSRSAFIAIGVDDTCIPKNGSHIPGVSYCRDPMSPPFQVNLILGKRFLQASVLLPLYLNNETPLSARAIPIEFEDIAPLKKPKKNAGESAWTIYKEEKKKKNMSMSFVTMTNNLRKKYDDAGAQDKILVMVGDGSFCNQTVFTQEFDRCVIVARARKDARLCFRAKGKTRRFYDKHKFSPEQIRKDETIPYGATNVFFGSKKREVRYKEVSDVYWQRGAKRKKLRLIVIAPTGYRLTKKSKKYYRDPAYLFTTDLTTPVSILIQMYFDRVQIEFNFRDEKQIIGVGQSQVRNKNAVPRQPAFVVAAYSLLLFSALNLYGGERTNDYLPLPKWRSQQPNRASTLDIIELLRYDYCEEHEFLSEFHINSSPKQLAACGWG
jgi:hypothetical protein